MVMTKALKRENYDRKKLVVVRDRSVARVGSVDSLVD